MKKSGFPARDLWILAFSILIVALAPSFQSFWIDEGTTGLLSRAPTFSDLQRTLDEIKGSEALMPLTTSYFWAMEKVVGGDEWALRCCNLPWLWLGIVCLTLVGRRINWPWLPLLFALHPVVWFYADEVRPYAVQLGSGSWLTLGFVQILQSEGKQGRGFWNFGFAALTTIASSFLGIFVVASAALVLVLKALFGRWPIPLRHYAIVAFFAVTNAVLAFNMLLKISGGAGGSKSWAVGLSNFGFASYELLGFIGLGPGRELIRTSAVAGGVDAASHLLIPSFFKLGLLVIIYLAVGFAAFRATKLASNKPILYVGLLSGAVGLVSVFCLFGAALESRFPFWGRHLAPTLPFILLAIGGIASSLESVWTVRQRCLLLIPLFVVLSYSSAVIRWSPTHAKDDYRTATALARDEVARGKRVCWIAAGGPALYYGLNLSKTWPPVYGTASLYVPPEDTAFPPDVLIVSKPDLFDRQRSLPHWKSVSGVQASFPCQSFVIYQLPSVP